MTALRSLGFEICIDGLSFWLMRSARAIGRGTSGQALRERRPCQERADAQQAALPVQSLRPELYRHAPTRQAAGPEGGGRAALRQRPVDEPHRPAAGCLDPHHPGLAGAGRGRLPAKARAGRPRGGDRAGRDVALSEKKSEPLWIWKAWDRASGQLVDWECGDRDKATCERLLERLTRWRASGGARSWSQKPRGWWTSASPCSPASLAIIGSAIPYLCWPNTLGQ